MPGWARIGADCAVVVVLLAAGYTAAAEATAPEAAGPRKVSSQDMRPFLGVTATVHDEPTTVDGRTFPRGLQIDFVTPDSGAASAGLEAGDVLVAVAGVDFDGPVDELVPRFRAAIAAKAVGDTIALTAVRHDVQQVAMLGAQPVADPAAWDDPRAFVAARPVGTTLELRSTHAARLIETQAPLGVRPTQNPSSAKIPPNDALFAQPVATMPVEALAQRLLSEAAAEADYEKLCARLAKLVEQGDPWRLGRVAYAMREPFATAALSREIADVPPDLAGALLHAARCLDWQPCVQAPTIDVPDTVEQCAVQIEAMLLAAHEHYEQAFRDLSAEERAALRKSLGAVEASFRDVVMVLVDPDKTRLATVRRFVALAQRVDHARLVDAALALSPLLSPDYIARLARVLEDAGDGVIMQRDTPLGSIILAGRKAHWHRASAAVIVDLGGDDKYTQATATPFSIIIDLAGNDTYQASFDVAQGAGVLGVGMLLDAAGDDLYIGQHWAQGAAAVGVGVLHDRAGNDVYRADDYAQAAALAGVALLIDEAGNDRYESPRYAQALAMPGGFAALVDRDGADYYYCGGRDQTNYGTVGVFDAFGQGCGIGFRGLASGGLAVLRDEAGDDVYQGDNFAQGGGYYFGWGILVDDGGSDRYRGCRYAQAWAAHQALGFLEDRAGDDTYECWRTVGQSCSWDETITMLLDHAGNDVYSGTGPYGGGGFALCASHYNGWALLVDYAGRDVYQRFGGVPRADGNDVVSSFSLQLDLGGAADRYPSEHNDVVRHGNRHGFFGDLPGGVERALSAPGRLLAEE